MNPNLDKLQEFLESDSNKLLRLFVERMPFEATSLKAKHEIYELLSANEKLIELSSVYRKIAFDFHPDRYSQEPKVLQELATKCTQKLNEFWNKLKKKLETKIEKEQEQYQLIKTTLFTSEDVFSYDAFSSYWASRKKNNEKSPLNIRVPMVILAQLSVEIDKQVGAEIKEIAKLREEQPYQQAVQEAYKIYQEKYWEQQFIAYKDQRKKDLTQDYHRAIEKADVKRRKGMLWCLTLVGIPYGLWLLRQATKDKQAALKKKKEGLQVVANLSLEAFKKQHQNNDNTVPDYLTEELFITEMQRRCQSNSNSDDPIVEDTYCSEKWKNKHHFAMVEEEIRDLGTLVNRARKHNEKLLFEPKVGDDIKKEFLITSLEQLKAIAEYEQCGMPSKPSTSYQERAIDQPPVKSDSKAIVEYKQFGISSQPSTSTSHQERAAARPGL